MQNYSQFSLLLSGSKLVRNGSRGSELLPVVENVLSLRILQPDRPVSQVQHTCSNRKQYPQNRRPVAVEMHIAHGVWDLTIEIFIHVSHRVACIMSEVVGRWLEFYLTLSPLIILRLVVVSHIVPMRRVVQFLREFFVS